MTSSVFARCVLYGEECPPYCNEIADVREDLVAALHREGMPEITESTSTEIEVPGREVAPKGARLFCKLFGFGIRAVLRFATGNMSSQLLRLHRKKRISERNHLTLSINGGLKRLPVVDAYCLLVISMIAKSEAPWDMGCREAKSRALMESQIKLKNMAESAMGLMTNIHDVQYPKYQQTCEDYPTLDDIWQIYDGIAQFFKTLMAMIIRFERNDRISSEPKACARCRRELVSKTSYDLTVKVNSEYEFDRRFTYCNICDVTFVGLTRVTCRQKRPVPDDDDGESQPRAAKKKKVSMATKLHWMRCRLESLRLLLDYYDDSE